MEAAAAGCCLSGPSSSSLFLSTSDYAATPMLCWSLGLQAKPCSPSYSLTKRSKDKWRPWTCGWTSTSSPINAPKTSTRPATSSTRPTETQATRSSGSPKSTASTSLVLSRGTPRRQGCEDIQQHMNQSRSPPGLGDCRPKQMLNARPWWLRMHALVLWVHARRHVLEVTRLSNSVASTPQFIACAGSTCCCTLSARQNYPCVNTGCRSELGVLYESHYADVQVTTSASHGCGRRRGDGGWQGEADVKLTKSNNASLIMCTRAK